MSQHRHGVVVVEVPAEAFLVAKSSNRTTIGLVKRPREKNGSVAASPRS